MRIRMFGLLGLLATLGMSGLLVQGRAGDDPPAKTAPPAVAKCEAGEPALDAEERAMLKLINEYRAQNGKSTLEFSIALTCASQWMASDMATKDYFNHKDSLGRDPFKRMSALGYDHNTPRGENIASGLRDARATFDLWKSSSGHNATMLKPKYVVIGISRVYSEKAKQWFWVSDFGGKKDALLVDEEAVKAEAPALSAKPAPANEKKDGASPEGKKTGPEEKHDTGGERPSTRPLAP